MSNYQPQVLVHFKSQETAIIHNLQANDLDKECIYIVPLLQNRNIKSDITLIKVPKSLDLFHLFIMEAHKMCTSNSTVHCGFMTRHFTPQMLSIASTYFEEVSQSLAWKKSRILTLKSPKTEVTYPDPKHRILFENHLDESRIYQQYFGVFSAKHIDFATQFLLEHLELQSDDKTILDLASGNGVIASEIRSRKSETALHLLDDSLLAIESSKLNLIEGVNHFHWAYDLDQFQDDFFDLVVSNPPFHFEHENTIEIALQLFGGVARVLKKEGRFVLVANRHLNYSTHLNIVFSRARIVKQNEKFEIIECNA